MKRDIHPQYVETKVTCSCGATFTTRSTATRGEILSAEGVRGTVSADYVKFGYDVREQIVQLVRYHLLPGMFYKSQPGDGAFRRLARKVEPDLLYRVARADSLGRNPEWLPKEKWFTLQK